MSAPTEEHWKKMTKLVDQFYNRPDAEPFREPVKWKEIGLFDYPKVIKNPMDLGTIRDKIKKGEYKTLFQVGEDVRLVWTNCMTYNQDGSDFYKLADSLHRKWDDKYTKLLQECTNNNNSNNKEGGGGAATVAAAAAAGGTAAAAGTGTLAVATAAAAAASGGGVDASSGASKAATLKEKREFAKALFAITKEDLGKVLVEVEAKCPAAITRNSTEDELELNVDKITAPVLQELVKFVDSVTKKNNKKKSSHSSKKAKTG